MAHDIESLLPLCLPIPDTIQPKESSTGIAFPMHDHSQPVQVNGNIRMIKGYHVRQVQEMVTGFADIELGPNQFYCRRCRLLWSEGAIDIALPRPTNEPTKSGCNKSPCEVLFNIIAFLEIHIPNPTTNNRSMLLLEVFSWNRTFNLKLLTRSLYFKWNNWAANLYPVQLLMLIPMSELAFSFSVIVDVNSSMALIMWNFDIKR